MSARPAHASKWTRIAATIDNARKPEPTRIVKKWPADALKELQKHLASFPDTKLYYSEDHRF